MSSPAWDLQRAVYAALVGDAALIALLGGAHVYDQVPRGAAFPYVTFGPSTVRDWSTGTERGSEHVLVLHAWSKGGGEKDVHLILEAIRNVLHEADLPVEGCHLVSLRHEISDATRDTDREIYHGAARVRAVIEPAP